MNRALRWRRRDLPLACAAVAGVGPVAHRLRGATADRVGTGALIRACADAEWIVLLGDRDDLPWADGAVYLGWESGILLPTTVAPSLPAELIRRAVGGRPTDLVAVVPGCVLVSEMPVRPVDVGRLELL